MGLATLAPLSAHANVVISEFLYDAPGSDTNQEWVELFNAGGSSVDLSKWKINDGSNHILNAPPKNGSTGSLTLASGGYIILADDANAFLSSHSGIGVSVIDSTLALPNTTGSVSLIDDNGSVVDSVSYTKDVGGAGDGNTLQRGSVSSASVLPGAPTPGTGNLVAQAPDLNQGNQGTDSSGTSSSTSQGTQTSGTTPPASYVPPPTPTLFADAGADKTVIVGADTVFAGNAYGKGKTTPQYVRYLWNFGDGITAEGKSVFHRYDYPGRYAVVLTVAQDKDQATDRITVTAEPAKLAFQALEDGGISIANSAGHDLDLSGWIVGSGEQKFMIPSGTLVLSGATLRVAQKTLGFFASSATALEYPNGALALQATENIADTSVSSSPSPAPKPKPKKTPAPKKVAHKSPPPAPAPVEDPVSEDTVLADPPPEIATTTDMEVPLNTPPTAIVENQVASVAAGISASPWFLGVISLAVAAGGAGWMVRRSKKKEWDIEEMPDDV